ncbi:hypothetical protein BT67DRAFT_440555 [Trichocladium antarcticum]|uniref:Secreted protein n=1 Tax=Trichocladium antarcticum TaxID=1450529 RepID=A0AAN6UPR8_9PEZI|nr:hypothetical protein BT67DRAFT_440555 [Trichocladium antarcticum]
MTPFVLFPVLVGCCFFLFLQLSEWSKDNSAASVGKFAGSHARVKKTIRDGAISTLKRGVIQKSQWTGLRDCGLTQGMPRSEVREKDSGRSEECRDAADPGKRRGPTPNLGFGLRAAATQGP